MTTVIFVDSIYSPKQLNQPHQTARERLSQPTSSSGDEKQALSLFFIYQDLPGLPMALRVSGRLMVCPRRHVVV
ncbi:hypothetical protein ACWCQZ_51425, partial [Streptomyces sp. NPDC002285]